MQGLFLWDFIRDFIRIIKENKMAKFKCLLSGTVVSFEYEHDIVQMRKHPQYEEVVEKKIEVKKEEVKVSPKFKE
jgi:hypothetical protein